MSPSFSGAPNTDSDNSSSPTSSLFKFLTFTTGIVPLPFLLATQDTTFALDASPFKSSPARPFSRQQALSLAAHSTVLPLHLLDHYIGACRTRHSPPYHQEVPFGIHCNHQQILRGLLSITHMTRHPRSFDHP